MPDVADFDLNTLVLARGPHQAGTNAWCFTEAVAQYLTEIDSDKNAADTSRHLRVVGQVLNDVLPDDRRQQLKQFIVPVAQTTLEQGAEDRRAWIAVDWLVRDFTPTWLDRIGLLSMANSLREREAVTSAATARAAEVYLRSVNIAVRGKLLPQQVAVGAPTSTGHRAYTSVIASGGMAAMRVSEVSQEVLIRQAQHYMGTLDITSAKEATAGTVAALQGRAVAMYGRMVGA